MKKEIFLIGTLIVMILSIQKIYCAEQQDIPALMDSPPDTLATKTRKKIMFSMARGGSIIISNHTISDLIVLIRDANKNVLTRRIRKVASQVHQGNKVIKQIKNQLVPGKAFLPGGTRLKVLYPQGTLLPLNVCLWDKEDKTYTLKNCDWADGIGSSSYPLDGDQWEIMGSLQNGLHVIRTTRTSRATDSKEGEPRHVPLY